MAQATLILGDYGEYITFYLKEVNPITNLESSFDLTNATTINFRAQKYGETTVRVSGTCEVYGDATLGVCRYLTRDTDDWAIGDFYAEVEIVSASAIETWIDIHIDVVAQLPK